MTFTIEYMKAISEPQEMSESEQEDWVSCIGILSEGRFISGSYDGKLRIYSEKFE